MEKGRMIVAQNKELYVFFAGCLNHNILKNVFVHFVRVRDGKKSSKIKQHAVIYFMLLGQQENPEKTLAT